MKLFFSGDREKVSQKWNWGFMNDTMLRNWTQYGKKIIDEQEYKDLQEMEKH